jgi:hypothetical protein
MKAGFASALITPPLGARMEGYGNRDRAKGAESVGDELYVRALYVEQEGEVVLLLAYDTCFFSRANADRLKGAVGRATDLAPRQILINASHTHSGGWASQWGDTATLAPDWAWLDLVERRSIEAARRARDCVRPATLWAGTGHTSLPVSRRRPDGKGGVQWAPYPEGVVCNLLPVVLFRGEDGDPICVLFSASCHPSTIGGWVLSADYPGAACAALDARFGGGVAMFLQGAAGDTKARVIADMQAADGPLWRKGTPEDVRVAGEGLAREVEAVLAGGLMERSPRVGTALIEVEWPLEAMPSREAVAADLASDRVVRKFWAGQLLSRLDRGLPVPDSASLLVQGVRLGQDVRIVAVEGELVGELGLRVAGRFADGVTFPLGYSNGTGLYLPTARMLAEGGYEAESYFEYGFAAPLRQAGEGVLDGAVDALRRQILESE